MTISAISSAARTLPPRALELIADALARGVDMRSIRFRRGENRRYRQLIDARDCNAWLIAWKASGALGMHDHGGSDGTVRVVAGQLVETYVDFADQTQPVTRVATAGQTLEVPSYRIHEVWNPGPNVAVSVHVYSPPLSDMEFFDRNLDGIIAG